MTAKTDAEGSDPDPNSIELREFTKLQKSTNKISAMPPTYAKAYAQLKLDPQKPTYQPPHGAAPLDIHPWQIQAVAWMIDMEQEFGSALLGDDMGLGKTLDALMLVDLSVSLGLPGPYKTTLILFPANAFAVWKLEIARWFSHLPLRYFTGV